MKSVKEIPVYRIGLRAPVKPRRKAKEVELAYHAALFASPRLRVSQTAASETVSIYARIHRAIGSNR